MNRGIDRNDIYRGIAWVALWAVGVIVLNSLVKAHLIPWFTPMVFGGAVGLLWATAQRRSQR